MENGKPGERYILNSENLTFLEIFNTIAFALKKNEITNTIPRWVYKPALAGSYILENVLNLMGKESKLTSNTIKISWEYRYFDSSKASEQLGWQPKVKFIDACREAVEFYKSIGVL
jgi:dihydroflavonol-4-reductase